MRNFIQFVQFKKREKHPWRSVASVKLQACRGTLFHGYFSRLLNCTNPANICWSSRRLQHVFGVTIFRLPSSLQDVLKIRLENVLKTSSRRLARCLQDVFKTYLLDVLKTSWKTKNCYAEDVSKTSWR